MKDPIRAKQKQLEKKLNQVAHRKQRAVDDDFLTALEETAVVAQQALREKVPEKKHKEVELVRAEMARRALARKHLLPFVLRNEASYLAGWFHKDLCKRLEKFSQDVIDGKSPRLMITVPPRHGKSRLASINFPAWHLGRRPDHEIIAASYAGSLSMSFSRKVREIIRSKSYQVLFPDTQLSPDSQSVEAWNTTKGGGYVAAGVGSGITGKGAHIAIIDDPVKDREEAESEVRRQAVKDWYTSTLYTRLAPGGGVLVIQTRWHDDDLAGWLESEMESGGDRREIIRYPAIATEDEEYRKQGEPLHPEVIPPFPVP